MKKIIATVLAMVMALALCTTAFAASTTYVAETVGGTPVVSLADGQTLSLEKFATGNADAKTFDTYKLWVTTTKTGAKVEAKDSSGKELGQLWITVSSACDYVFVNGTSVTYLVKAVDNKTWDDTAKLMTVEKAASAEKATCGSFWSTTGGTAVSYDSKAYDAAKTGDTLLNIDGKAAWITKGTTAANVTEKKHAYVADKATVNGDETVTKVYCDNCKASFEFVVGSVTDATLKFGAGNFTETSLTVGTDKVFVKTGSATPAGTTGTTTSPKTFDAGIAMYVGMALTSVAGSAVVIGKKKEF